MNSFTAEIAVDNQIVALLAATGFNDSLSNCAERSGDYRASDQGQCGWFGVRGQRFDRQQTSDNLGFDDRGWQIAGGGQINAGNGWIVGAALAYDHHNVAVNESSARSDGDQFQGGVMALRRFGPTELSGVISFGYGTFDNQRTLLGGTSTSATERLWLVGGQLRAAYPISMGNWTIKPRVGVGLQYLAMESYAESGSSSLRLYVDSQSDTYAYVQAGVDLATKVQASEGMLVWPRLTLGLTQLVGPAAPSVTARFANAPGDVASFTTSTALDRTRFDVAAAVDVFVRKDVSVRAEAFGGFTDNSQTYGGGLKLSWAF